MTRHQDHRWGAEATARGCVVLLVAFIVLLLVPTSARAEEPSGAEAIDAALHHAETYYWFGMAERGNMAAYAKGIRHLDAAQAALDTTTLDDTTRAAYRARIHALRVDLDEQAEIGHDSMNGVFPLFRFLTSSLFADQTNLATFELLDDPAVMVTTAAAKQLAWVALKNWSRKAQMDVAFTSVPRDPALENEALYVFNVIPKFFVHNQREAVDALPAPERERFFRGDVTPDAVEAMLEKFGVTELLVVLVLKVDDVDGDVFGIVEGRLYAQGTPAPVHRFQVMGFSRDRRTWFVPLAVTTLLLLLLAYAAFAIVATYRRRAATRVAPIAYLLVPVVAFFIGRLLPWALVPALRSFAPAPENLAIVSFWAPVTAGLVILVLPMVLYWIIASRLSHLFPALAFEGRGAATCVAIGAGVVAYLAVPAFLYLEAGAVPVLVVLTIGVVLIAFLLGRALDSAEHLHGAFAVLAALLAMALLAAFLLGSLPWLAGVTLLAALALGAPALVAARSHQPARRPRTRRPGADGVAPVVGTGSGALADRVVEPVFRPTDAYEEAWRRLAPFREGKAMRLGLVGGRGSGLSRTLDELVNQLESAYDEKKPELLVLDGRRVSGGQGRAPFAPFREALASHFAVSLLVAPESKDARLDSSLGGLLGSLLPFGSLLVPDTSDLASRTSRQNLFASVLWMLRRLARKRPVALVLDDVEDFDAASADLLAYLARHIPVGTPEPVLLLAASHEASALEDADFPSPAHIVTIPYPSSDVQVDILAEGIGLERKTAGAIVDRVGTASASTYGMTRVLLVVSDLVREGAFEETPEGFAWPSDTWPASVRLPDEVADLVRRHLATSPAIRRTLAAAACAVQGLVFEAQILAEVLEVSRLDLLTQLDTIQDETGIVRDVGEQDDVYAFASDFMLEAVRAELRVRETGPEDAGVPQIVRELYARVAEALERTLEQNPQALYRVADLYFAAGARHAARAVEWGRRAAKARAAAADFEGAERSLDRVDVAARATGRPEAAVEDRLVIEAQRANVTGDPELCARVARDGAAYVARKEDAPIDLLLSVAQAHYDAGKSSGDGAWFAEAVCLGKRVIEHADNVLDEAAGHHLVGVSLPRDDRAMRLAEEGTALTLLEGVPADDPDALLLKGRVLGALAEERMHGDSDEREKARALLEQRLDLLTSSGVGDPRGLAMSHGALGRLAFFFEPRDLASARMHFEQDLEISEAIGDREGRVQMHSLLGACALEDGDEATALTHYEASWELGTALISRSFAGAGLLHVHAARGDGAALDEVARTLAEALASASVPLPKGAAAALEQALEAVPTPLRSEAIDTLATGIRTPQ